MREAVEEDVQLGQLLPDLAHPVQQEILRGSFYTPELMVAGDIRAEEIRLVWGTVVRCEDCYSLTEQGECRLVTQVIR